MPLYLPLLASEPSIHVSLSPSALMRTCPSWSQQAWAILWDEVMLLTGMLALITAGWQRALWTGVTHVAMLPVLPYISKGFQE